MMKGNHAWARLLKHKVLFGVCVCVGLGAAGYVTAQSFNNIPVNGSNSFNTTWESFDTSTKSADTPYVNYATWDDDWIYLGMTGSDIGGGDCSDLTLADCYAFENGQSTSKYLVYYFDVDPSMDTGATQARAISGSNQSWKLPDGLKADYMVEIRTDGQNAQSGAYTGNAFLYKYEGGSWSQVTSASGPDAGGDFQIWDNNGSAFLEMALKRDALVPPSELNSRRSPSQIATVGWMVNTEDFGSTMDDDRISYAYWPASAAEGSYDSNGNGTTSGMVELKSYYGFVLDAAQLPNASNGQANLNRPFGGNWDCPAAFPGDVGQATGQGNAFHTIPINGSNGFNTTKESFPTSTTASTGYTAYATWDRSKLYFGYTGSDVGGGDCSDPSAPDCDTFELGQSPEKWLVYYIDTDPKGNEGSNQATVPMAFADTSMEPTLSFNADYAVYIRTDGASADASPYTGVATMLKYDGGQWKDMGPCGLSVYDNNGSGFLEFSVDLTNLGSPVAIQTTSWILDAGRDEAYAFWPDDAASSFNSKGVATSSPTLDKAWGFELVDGVIPNASGNKQKTFGTLADNQRTPSTYTIDGSTGPKEALPKHFLGRESGSKPAMYMSWDATNVYLSLTGGTLLNEDHALYVALDSDPVTGQDPQMGSGSIDEPNVGPAANDSNDPVYPFSANKVVRVAGTDSADSSAVTLEGESYSWNNGSWSQSPLGAGQVWRAGTQGTTEIAIPWSALGISQDQAFNVVFYLSESGNGLSSQWPTANPQGQTPTLDTFFSYYRRDGVEPFSRAYVSKRVDSGSTLSEALYHNLYLIVPNASMNSATFSLGENTTFVGELYVGQGATLDFGDNQNNPSGRNSVRVGRQLTATGTLDIRGGVLYTFDPQKGFPEEQEPSPGFAVPSTSTTLKCVSELDALVLYNDTELASCAMP